MKFKIEFTSSQQQFEKFNFIWESDWFDMSYLGEKKAIGRLRYTPVGNGRYESEHPILDSANNNVGFLVKAKATLGYTYNCIYVDQAECFYISNIPFSAVWGKGHKASYISIVSRTGKFIFGNKGSKFERTKLFEFPYNWGNHALSFKLIEEQRYLFYLTQYGFCLISTCEQELVSRNTFDDLSYTIKGFSLSPKANILAAIFSVNDYKDPLDGKDRYKNLINIYDLETGQQIGQKNLDTNEYTNWEIAFSKDGRQLVIISQTDQSEQIFDLDAKR